MIAPLFQTLERTLVAGVVLLLAIILVAGAVTGRFVNVGDPAYWAFVMRWLHIASGIMWLGLLFYLNFVQIPAVPKIEPVEHRAAIGKFIMPNLLFWFRYAALATVVTGLLLAWQNGYLVEALTLRPGVYPIGIGMWLALILAFNVWFIIWPKQQKVLGLVEASADEKAEAARVALLTSRINLMLSIPMLYAMAAQSHGGL